MTFRYPTRNGVVVRGPLKPLPVLGDDTKAFIYSSVGRGTLLWKEEPRYHPYSGYSAGRLMLVDARAVTGWVDTGRLYTNLLDPATKVDISHLSEEYRLHCVEAYNQYYEGKDVALPHGTSVPSTL